MGPHCPRCAWTVWWIGADTDEAALLSGRASDLWQKVFELAEEVLFVFEKRLYLHIDLLRRNERHFRGRNKSKRGSFQFGTLENTHVVHHPLFSLLVSYWVLQRVLLLLSVCLQDL